jgi:hypothetical protein
MAMENHEKCTCMFVLIAARYSIVEGGSFPLSGEMK